MMPRSTESAVKKHNIHAASHCVVIRNSRAGLPLLSTTQHNVLPNKIARMYESGRLYIPQGYFLNPETRMSSPQEMLDYARELSIQGVEDFHMRLLARKATQRKELIQAIDELIDTSAAVEVVGILRKERTVTVEPVAPCPVVNPTPAVRGPIRATPRKTLTERRMA